MVALNVFKKFLKINDNSEDVFLQLCLDNALGEIENFCNRKFTDGTYTEYLSGNNSDEIFLRNFPIDEITGIELYNDYDGYEDIFDGTTFTIANSSLIIPEKNILKLLKGFYFIKGRNNFKITYTAGFTSTTITNDLQKIIIDLASIEYYNSKVSGEARLGISGTNLGGGVSEGKTFKDIDLSKILKNYRIINI